MWWEKNCPDLPGGNLNAGTRPQQTPVFNCLHPSSQTSLEISFSLFFWEGASKESVIEAAPFPMHPPIIQKTQSFAFQNKSPSGLPCLPNKKPGVLMRLLCCPDTARFMVISRIDNIKYGGTGLSNQAAIHKSSSVHWSRC